MAEPFSIVSGIAGVLSFGIQVTQSLVEFYTAYKGQDASLAKTTRNLDNILTIFRSLDLAIKERQAQPDTQDLLQEVKKAVDRCKEIITELQSECEKFHKGSAEATSFKNQARAASRRLAYPFRKSTLAKLEEDIGDIRENLSFALDVLQLKSHNQIQLKLSDVKSIVERTNASQISVEIRGWLMAPDVSVNHNAMCLKCHPSTGLWFVHGQQYRDWLQGSNSFLWLNGFAGCGKSVLCSTAIQHTALETGHKDGVGIAFFYFSFSDKEKQDDAGMLRTLLLQLSVQLENGERNLEELHKLHRSGSPPVHALLDSLRSLLERFHDTYILLDALDESPRGCQRDSVLRAIEVIRGWSISGLHLLVTSRNEQDIRESLLASPEHDIPLRNSEVSSDIANFISYQLENDAKLQRWKARHDEIQTELKTKAQGVFRYVECQFNALRRVKTRNQLDQCLRALPRDLDETYDRILCNIEDEYVDDVRRVLTLLCFSMQPLTINELIDAHAVDLSDPPSLDRGRSYEQDDLVDVCLGLIEITSTGRYDDDYNNYDYDYYDGPTVLTVRIAHFSVQEYLQSDRILQQNSRGFSMQSAPAHTEISQICLVCLLKPALSEGALNKSKISEFPFALYAARYWFEHHSVSAEGKPTIEKLASDLFKLKSKLKSKAFVTWIRLHDPDLDWNWDHGLDRSPQDIALPLYYVGLLGLEFLLNSIFPVSTKHKGLLEMLNACSGQVGNVLQAASYGGHETVVRMILDRNADVNAQGGKLGNALHAASYSGHINVVQMILERNADINAQGGKFGSALQTASSAGHRTIVKLLLDQGADINAQGGFYGNALKAASYEGHETIVKLLLDQGADINEEGGYYGNALQAASFGGRETIVKLLLDRGADVNAQGGYFGNALQAASCRGKKNLVRMLLDRGAAVNAQGGHYGNALQAASYRGKENLVQMLLDRGADVNAQSGYYGDALKSASEERNQNIVQLLLERGAESVEVNTQ